MDNLEKFFRSSRIVRTKEVEEIFLFINSEYSLERMKFCCELGIPAISALALDLEMNHTHFLESSLNRQNIGRIIKFTMTSIGYVPVGRSRVSKKISRKFATSTIYNKI